MTTNNTNAAHTSYWETSEVVFGIGLVVGIVIGLLFPIPFPSAIPGAVLILFGVILILLGIALVILSKQHLTQSGQPSAPGIPTTKILSTGVYSRSRNPMYTGLAFIFAGLSFAFNAVWLLILLIPTLVAVYIILIAPEERYLEAQFGSDYLSYKQSVRRWL